MRAEGTFLPKHLFLEKGEAKTCLVSTSFTFSDHFFVVVIFLRLLNTLA